MREVIQEALEAYSGAEGKRVIFDGPDLRINPKAALAMSMGLHELATNAVKYGALSNQNGRIHITWKSLSFVGRNWEALL